ncbi:phage N-6-adenine-methyltransferase [Klebsiella michiganensis]|uniref:phage N-6-adenine-methyltransferase n=1 Tax=Klebsiella michiganensis TaxID=1134687 RepID=UPI003D99C802
MSVNTPLIYGSICSGIEAATVAWEPLGWKAAWFSEIEAFPSAVLAERWPEVVNLGDMTKIAAAIRAGKVQAPDVMVGGTPCQAFSIAGLRNGLADARGQLTLSYVELANAIDAKRRERGEPESIIVWENVPGVLSSKDNAFGCFLAGLAGESSELQPAGGKWTHAGCVSGPERVIAWRVLDAQFFGVAQRRRRVFVVASARKGFDPAAVLFELDSVRRDSAPSRTSQTDTSTHARKSSDNGSHWDDPKNPHPTLNQSHNIGGIGQSNQELFSQRGSGIVAMAHGQGGAEIKTDDSAPTLTCNHEAPIAACAEGTGWDNQEKRIHPVNSGTYPTLSSRSNGGGTVDGYISYPDQMSGVSVRRLTPIECERLQGFPDNHTLISWRGKEATDCPDGPRYRAIGNSMAVPVMRWIGERIEAALPPKKSAGDYGGSKTPVEQRNLWQTPIPLFVALDAEFCLTLDSAASADNALCNHYITEEQNTLETPWDDYLSIPGYVWLNPPYSDITPFVKKAAAESANQIGTVMLVPADTSVGWFREAIETASEVRFIVGGRLAFINPVSGKPVSGNNKGSMLIIWHPYPRTHCQFTTVERDVLMAFGEKLIARKNAA